MNAQDVRDEIAWFEEWRKTPEEADVIQPYSLRDDDDFDCAACGAWLCEHGVCGCYPCAKCERKTDDRFETFYRETLRSVNGVLGNDSN